MSAEDLYSHRRADRLIRRSIWAAIALGILAMIADAHFHRVYERLRQDQALQHQEQPATAAQIHAALARFSQESFRQCLRARWASGGLIAESDLGECESGAAGLSEADHALRRAQYLALQGNN